MFIKWRRDLHLGEFSANLSIHLGVSIAQAALPPALHDPPRQKESDIAIAAEVSEITIAYT